MHYSIITVSYSTAKGRPRLGRGNRVAWLVKHYLVYMYTGANDETILDKYTLFEGTMRYNLDPISVHSDEALLAAMERVRLGEPCVRRSSARAERT